MPLPGAGKDLLIKITNDAGSPALVAILGLRTKNITINSELIDITNSDSSGLWREILDSPSVKSASVNGAGVAKDNASLEVVRDMVFEGENRQCEITVPNFGVISGPFRCTSLEMSGEHGGAVISNFALESAGALSFSAA